jgi:hypothetical protein
MKKLSPEGSDLRGNQHPAPWVPIRDIGIEKIWGISSESQIDSGSFNVGGMPR